jgi:hypothetical protein
LMDACWLRHFADKLSMHYIISSFSKKFSSSPERLL